ncbi:MAG: 50S ribosomal protein L11 methyltransferase [Butyrivibrio sp.]|nr:50S ribosomal protein L11 methyltransferase [Butyrivibrio sp.]
MKWMRFRIRTNEESEDIIVSYLEDIGLEGAQIEDNVPLSAQDKEQMFIDAPELEPDDNGPAIEKGVAYLSFFLEIDDDNMLTVSCADENGEYVTEKRTPEQMQEAIREKLSELKSFSDIGDGTISVDVTEDIDWINNWKQYFHKFFIDDILVIPSWEKESGEDKEKANMVLHIDPGTAFGTGMHETTQLCIRMLKKYVTKDTVLLDVGTGSGVLSILALMFGARHAVGTDLDKCAVPAVKENMENNGISEDKFEMMIGNIIDDKQVQDKVGYDKYDIVVANILANVLVPLTPVILNNLKSGGIYITSGIIDTKEEEVKKAHLDAGLEILEIHHQGDWVSITSRKN